jgi:AraC family transcriptional regulator
MGSPSRHVPITMGSESARSVEVDGCLVTDAGFPPGAILPSHTHDRPVFAVMLAGRMETSIARRRLGCTFGSVWVEPLGERHENRVGSDGAHVLVMQPDVDRCDLFSVARPFLDSVHLVSQPDVLFDAFRLQHELESPDEFSGLSVTGLVMSTFAAVARARRGANGRRPVPAWLLRVVDAVHDEYRQRIDVRALATLAGVHPSHLAHAFREHLRCPLGSYVRRLRVAWAAQRLRTSELSIAEVAVAAGFSDQSHLSREFRRRLGVSPARYRHLYGCTRRSPCDSGKVRASPAGHGIPAQ